MDLLLVESIILITLTLVFYTLGAWGARLNNNIYIRHIVFNCLAFLSYCVGCIIVMGYMQHPSLNLQAITAIISCLILLFHTIYCIICFLKDDNQLIQKYNSCSIRSWVVWLIPYTASLIFGLF